jgi:DNA-binding transcriptional regulator YiaG
MSIKIVDTMTPGQCRAARALLDITQSQLARAASLGLSTVVDFEKERRVVSEEAVRAMRIALQRAGIEFSDGDGEGLRLRRPRHPRRK